MADVADGDLQQRFIGEKGIAAEIATLAGPVIEDLGLRLVRVSISAQNGTTVQIMADRADGAISIEDCARISRQLSPTDIDIHAREILKTREQLNQVLARHTGRSVEDISRDTDRDHFMNPDEALKYGVIDRVLDSRNVTKDNQKAK
jgi:hypothetical protein